MCIFSMHPVCIQNIDRSHVVDSGRYGLVFSSDAESALLLAHHSSTGAAAVFRHKYISVSADNEPVFLPDRAEPSHISTRMAYSC